MSSSPWKAFKAFNATVSNALHSILCGDISEVTISFTTKKAMACVWSGLGTSFLSSKKAEIMHHSLALLTSWADASASLKEIFTQFNSFSTFSMESSPELFFFMQSTFQVKEAFDLEGNRTCWNPAVNAGITTVKNVASLKASRVTRQKRFCFKNIWKKTLPMHRLQREMRRSTSHLDEVQSWSVWMAPTTTSSGCRVPGSILLTGEPFSPQCGHNHFETVTHDWCPRFFPIATAEENAFVLSCPGSLLYAFYSAAEKRTLVKTHQMERVTNPAFSKLFGLGQLQRAGAGWKKSSLLRYHA